MLYTVKEVASLSNVTVKTLHHYHKIGLLAPCAFSEAGYRLYGTKELERLQQILFYRELDFSLEQIKRLLEDAPDRLSILYEQEELLLRRKKRLETILETLRKSIVSTEKGEPMGEREMFQGFDNEEAWKEALQEQREHLKKTYDFDLLDEARIDVASMNDAAKEASAFMKGMAGALRAGIKHDDGKVVRLLRSHLDFLNRHGHAVTAADFAGQVRFLIGDEFHLRMLEGEQTGLAYYLLAAAEALAKEERT